MLFPSPVPQGSGWWRGRRASERAGTWLGGRKIISARRLCLRLKPYLHFKSGGRPCCHLRDAIDQPACHLMSADTGALMKLIEQSMIDNCSACQCLVSPSTTSQVEAPPLKRLPALRIPGAGRKSAAWSKDFRNNPGDFQQLWLINLRGWSIKMINNL